MTTTTRRVLWWSMTALLTIALMAAIAFAGYQAVKFLRPAPPPAADSAAARQAISDATKDHVTKLLSYTPEHIDEQLAKAADLTTGEFHDSYTKLTREKVIPAAKAGQITAVTTVPGVAVQALTDTTATTIAFVNQTTTAGSESPTTANSAVRVGWQKVNGEWLISEFQPL